MSNKKMIELVTLERNDVERSEIVRIMIDIYSYKPVEKPIEKQKEIMKEKNINNFNDAALIPIQYMKSNNLKKLK
jgi:hypothetical protein